MLTRNLAILSLTKDQLKKPVASDKKPKDECDGVARSYISESSTKLYGFVS